MATTLPKTKAKPEDTLKYLNSITEGIGGWLRYQDGKATALSAIVGVGLLDALGLTETSAFKEAGAAWHGVVVWLFWISLVAAGSAILLFALAIIPHFPEPGKGNSPRSLYYWRYIQELGADRLLTDAEGKDASEMCKEAAREAAALAGVLFWKARLVRGGWVAGLVFVAAWAVGRTFASL